MRYKLTFFLYREYLVHRCGGASGESKDSLISYCVASYTTWDYLAHNVTCKCGDAANQSAQLFIHFC